MPTYHDIAIALQRHSTFKCLEILSDHIEAPEAVVWVPQEDGSFVSQDKFQDKSLQAREVGGGVIRFSLWSGTGDPVIFGAAVGGATFGLVFRNRPAVVLGAVAGGVFGWMAKMKGMRVMSFHARDGKWALCEGPVANRGREIKKKPLALM